MRTFLEYAAGVALLLGSLAAVAYGFPLVFWAVHG